MAMAAAARDATRLEPLVGFFSKILYAMLIFCFSYENYLDHLNDDDDHDDHTSTIPNSPNMSKWQWQQ